MNAAHLLSRTALVLCGVVLVSVAQAEEEHARLSLAVTQDITPTSTLAQTTQSMLWARRQAVAFGVGVEQRSRRAVELQAAGGPAGPQLQSQSLLIGLSVAATERTSIALQAPVWRDAREREDQEPHGMALRSRDSLGELRAGLQMKMQLRDETTLAIRPRKRGVGVTLRSQW